VAFQRALSPEQEQNLVKDYTDDWTPHELTIIYRVSIRTVYRVLARHNVPRKVRRRFTPRRQSRTRRVTPKKPPVRALQPCGTNAAYQRHRRAGEYPCTPCLEAHAKNVSEAKKKRKRRETRASRRSKTGKA